MARIGIMTFLHNENCGSSLQAYALQRAIRDLGHEPLGLDYRPDRAEQVRNLLRSGNSPAVVLDSMMRRRGRGVRNTEGFDRFCREMLSLSAPARNGKELAACSAGCDLLLAGSDQIWSPEWLNGSYFFSFAGDQPRLAYACSLGVSAMPGRSKQRKLARLVRPFRHISVRETEGRDLLRQLLPDRQIDVDPDPVFLLSRRAWLETAGEPAPDGTLAAYFIKDDPAYHQKAREAAEAMRLRLVPLAVTPGMSALADAVLNPDPLGWLRRMASAEAVITDSFHGAAFAAILGKPLTILRRWQPDDPHSKNSRIDQLMRLMQWTDDRACLPSEEVEAAVMSQREQGLSWLREAIEESLEFRGQR